MSHPDNHIDELFRRAADHYQLNNQTGDWDDIATKLNLSSKKQVRNNHWFFIPLLFVFLSGLFFGTKDLEQSKVKTMQSHRNNDAESKVYRQERIQKSEAFSKSNVTTVNQNSHASLKVKRNTMNHGEAINKSNKIFKADSRTQGMTDIYQKDIFISEKPNNESRILVIQHENPAFGNSVIQKPDISMRVERFSDLTNRLLYRNTKVNNPVKVKSKNQPSFYLDFVFGLSFTEVKKQRLTKPGVEAGLRTGFRFAKNISLETGLIFSKKHYYSDGKYFKMDNNDPSMPGGMQVLNLSGSSAIFQVPLKLKFDVRKNQSKHFFATAGLSSFFLTKEKNDYLILVNGTKQQLSVTYPKTHRYFMATADISAGYQLNVHKRKSIRIEPYIQIPLRGIGVGRMPLTGAGIQIAYSIF